MTSARLIVTENKSTFTVFKVNCVPIRNNDELLKAVENRQAFIKNNQGKICTTNKCKVHILKMKSLPEIIGLNTSEFYKHLAA